MKNLTFYSSLLLNILFICGFFYLVNALGGFSYLRAKMKTKSLAGIYEHRKNHFKELPMQEDAIVMLGNSLTQSCEWSELLDNPKIVNRGISGDMTGGLLLRLGEITQHQPAKIFLMIGVNDLSVYSLDNILKNYEAIVADILLKTPTTKLYLQSLLPVNNQVRSSGKSNSDIVFLNKKIENIASENGLVFLNLHSLFLDKDGKLDSSLTQDGIHLDASGYLIWKKELEKYID
ncbi:MAG: GDSL-type esterase/lipase family protein [Saprospiraceae bacterium]